MSIALGIDIGSDKCVVAFVDKKGVVDVLQNEASKRETPVVVHFDKRQRLFGSAGAARANMDPKSTISQLKRLIGRRFDEQSFQRERTLFPYETSTGPDGEVMVNVRYLNEDMKFTAVQMLGMFLCYLKRMAEKATDSAISECVIGIPSYFTDQQRRDYLLAAEVAGLKPLRLFHDGAATAMDYGIYRNLPYGEEINVVFVDIGQSDTQVTMVKFVFGMAMVLAHSFDRDLGGRDFDNVIFKYLAENFFNKHRVDVSTHPKARFRLRVACEKIKRILSSNTDAPINIESLMNEKDLEEVITRKEFEDLSSSLVDRIRTVCDIVLGDSGLVAAQIHSVELAGSGSRIPIITKSLEEFFGHGKISRTLNGSECVANGCALQCAMLSSAHEITKFAVQDIFPFSISGYTSKDSLLPSIAKGPSLLSVKMLVLPPSETVTLSYANLRELPPDVSESINQYKIDSNNGRAYNLEVRILYDCHGIVSIQSVSEIFLERSGKAVKQLTAMLSESVCDVAFQNVLKEAQSLEAKLEKQDRDNERAKLIRNDLESILFQTRNELLRTIGKSAMSDHISVKLLALEEWLYGPGADESEMGYCEKKEELYMIQQEIVAEQEMAITRALQKKKDLEQFTFHKVMRAIFGRFQSFMMDVDYAHISSKIQEIEDVLRGRRIKSEEDYVNKLQELNLLIAPIENKYTVAQSASQEKVECPNIAKDTCPPRGHTPLPPSIFFVQEKASKIPKGGYIVIRGCPCLIIDVVCYSAENYGPALYRFLGIDIFNGEKLAESFPASHSCDIPHVLYLEYQLLHVSEFGFASLGTDSARQMDRIWLSTDEYILGLIRGELAKQKVCVTVISAMEEVQIISVNLLHPLFDHLQLAGTIRADTIILIGDRPCVVVEVSTSRDPYLGPATCHFVGTDIFNGETLEYDVPASHYLVVPRVSFTNHHLIRICTEGAILRNISGDLHSDVLVPYQKTLLDQINQQLTGQEFLMVSVVSAMEKKLIWSTNPINSKLERRQLACTIRLNTYMLIKDRPCAVIEARVNKAEKGRSSSCRFSGVDIFDGEMLAVVVPANQYCDVPFVSHTVYLLTSISEDGTAFLSNGPQNKLVKVLDKTMIQIIKKRKTEGEEVTVTVISAMGKELIFSIKYEHLKCHQLAGTIRANTYIVLKKRSCKVVEASTHSERNRGPAKCHFLGVDIFNGKKLEDAFSPSQYCIVPCILYIRYRLVDITNNGTGNLVTVTGDSRDPLLLSTDKNLIGQIRDNIAQGNTVIVTIMSADGGEILHSLEYIHPLKEKPSEKRFTASLVQLPECEEQKLLQS